MVITEKIFDSLNIMTSTLGDNVKITFEDDPETQLYSYKRVKLQYPDYIVTVSQVGVSTLRIKLLHANLARLDILNTEAHAKQLTSITRAIECCRATARYDNLHWTLTYE